MLKLIRLTFYLTFRRGLLYFSLFTFSFSLFFSSCSTFDPPLVVPAYGHIDSIHFTVPFDSTPKQGSASSNIQYAWVYLDDNPIGSFQLPCTFPMVASNGSHNIKVYPGVVPVGTTSPAGIYPFYQFYSLNINLAQGSTYRLQPSSVYYSWCQFPYKENFEESTGGSQPKYIVNYYGGGNHAAATTTTMVVTNRHNLAFQGKSGMVVVSQGHDYYIGVTDTCTLPNSSQAVDMELNYRCTTSFTIGMFEGDTISQSNPIVVVFPTSKWTKMYISLNSTIQQTSALPIFGNIHEIYFTMSRDSDNGHTTDTLLLDNIKILD